MMTPTKTMPVHILPVITPSSGGLGGRSIIVGFTDILFAGINRSQGCAHKRRANRSGRRSSRDIRRSTTWLLRAQYSSR